MSITTINEVKSQQTGAWSSDGTRTYLRILQLISDDPKDDSAVVLQATLNHLGVSQGALAVIYECGNGIDTGAYLKKVSVRQDTSKKGEYRNWEARLDYDAVLQQQPDNPLLRPTNIDGDFQMYQKPVEKDVNGKPILNAAKKKLEGIEIDDPRPHVSMTRNEVDYDWAYFANNWVNRINLTPWYGCATNKVKIANVKGTGPHTENNVTFYTVTYEFQYRQEGWKGSYLNRGLYDINGVRLVDRNNRPLDEPGFLDKGGLQLPFPIVQANVNYIDADHYFQAEFNLLGLP